MNVNEQAHPVASPADIPGADNTYGPPTTMPITPHSLPVEEPSSAVSAANISPVINERRTDDDPAWMTPEMIPNPRRVMWLKVKNNIGLSGKSVNPQFQTALRNLENINSTVKAQLQSAEQYLAWLKQSPQQDTTTELQAFFQSSEAQEGLADDGNAQEAVGDLGNLAAAISSATGSAKAAYEQYEAEVIGGLQKWLDDFVKLQPKIDALHQAHLLRDHYNHKNKSLRTAAEKRKLKPATENKQTVEHEQRLARNATKAKQAQAGFDGMNAALIVEMEAIHARRFVALAPAARGYAQFHAERHAAFAFGKRG